MIKFIKKPESVQSIYLYLILGNTLAASFIWGINTIFLLDAGLSNFEAFMANAFFSLGQVIFEIPTGVVADTFGRRKSYILGTITLAISTILYLLMWQIRGPFWGWALSSILLGLGFTFFSGALEAWLVDALKFTKFKGSLDSVFARGQMVGGAAMLAGSFLGGLIAQYSSLGIPYILRAVILAVNFATAYFFMHDVGYEPKKAEKPVAEMKTIMKNSLKHGFGNRPVRWVMLSSPFITGVSFYVFYALQPFLLDLYGDQKAYTIAGFVASLAALAQIAGGFLAPRIKRLFKFRTQMLFVSLMMAVFLLAAVSRIDNFWIVLVLIFVWGLVEAAILPVRQAFLNSLIPSEQRATVLSFDSLMGSSGGIVVQPALGRVSDVYGYAGSFFVAGLIHSMALPFVYLARRENSKSDLIEQEVSSR